MSEAAVDAPASRIVVGVDGTPSSAPVLAWAAQEARIRNAVLEIVHVDFTRSEALQLFAPGLVRNAEATLDAAVARAKSLEPQIVVRGRTCEPPAAEALIDASEGAELLVVGTRGFRGLRALEMGSVSSSCACHARCPVAIVRSFAPAEPPDDRQVPD